MKNRKIIISFVILIFIFHNKSIARYYEVIRNIKCEATIAEPIIVVENLQDTIALEFNKLSGKQEYYFIVKNYKIDDTNNKKITEVSFDYSIEVKQKDKNFPVKYKLYDCDLGVEILNGKNKVEKISIMKDIEYIKKYKLVIEWNSKEVMSSSTDINIVIDMSQIQE